MISAPVLLPKEARTSSCTIGRQFRATGQSVQVFVGKQLATLHAAASLAAAPTAPTTQEI